MAKKKGRPKADTAGAGTRNGLVVRGSPEWREWVKRLAKHNRLTAADIIDQGLIDLAKKTGFKEAAPQRKEGQ